MGLSPRETMRESHRGQRRCPSEGSDGLGVCTPVIHTDTFSSPPPTPPPPPPYQYCQNNCILLADPPNPNPYQQQLFGYLLLHVEQELIVRQRRLSPILNHVLHEVGLQLAFIPRAEKGKL